MKYCVFLTCLADVTPVAWKLPYIHKGEAFMRVLRSALMLILILMVMALAACDDASNSQDDASGQTAGLSQTYDEAGLSFSFPEGWVFKQEPSTVLIASSQEVLDIMSTTEDAQIPDGGQAVTILGFPAPIESGLGQQDILDLILESSADDAGTQVADSEDVTLGDADGLRVAFSDDGAKGEGAIYILRSNDQVIVAVIALSSAGDYDDALTQSIAATVSFTPPSE